MGDDFVHRISVNDPHSVDVFPGEVMKRLVMLTSLLGILLIAPPESAGSSVSPELPPDGAPISKGKPDEAVAEPVRLHDLWLPMAGLVSLLLVVRIVRNESDWRRGGADGGERE